MGGLGLTLSANIIRYLRVLVGEVVQFPGVILEVEEPVRVVDVQARAVGPAL